jgi:hypothetical protein
MQEWWKGGRREERHLVSLEEVFFFIFNNPTGIYMVWVRDWRYGGNMIWGVSVGLASIYLFCFLEGCGNGSMGLRGKGRSKEKNMIGKNGWLGGMRVVENFVYPAVFFLFSVCSFVGGIHNI